MTARYIEGIIRMAEANARIELRDHVKSKDLDNAIGVMLESFIQSQKHQIAEELRKKFRRYIAQATPLSDQFMRLLERLFHREAQLRGGVGEAGAGSVSIDMSTLVDAVEREDLDLDEAHTFMRTERFRRHFRESDGRLYQIV